MKRFAFSLTLLLTLFAIGTAYSQELSPEWEGEAKKIEARLIAPCCMTQQVSVHSSPVTDEMKVDIRKMLVEGKTEKEIIDHYVTKYGLEILSSPPQTGFNRLSVMMPVIFFLLGITVVAAIIKVWAGHHPKNLAVSSAIGAVNHDVTRRH